MTATDERRDIATPSPADPERALLCAVAWSPQALEDALAAGVIGRTFSHPARAAIWDALRTLRAQGAPTDAAALHGELQRKGDRLSIAAAGLLPDILTLGTVTTEAGYHAATIVEKARARDGKTLAVRLGQMYDQPDVDHAAIAGLLREHLEDEAARSTEPPSRYDQINDALLNSEGLKTLTPPAPLVAGYIMRDSLTWLQGKPGHGKSFVAIDLACSVSTGQPWRGSAVHQGTVLYVIAEGASGLGIRVDAWRDANGVQDLGDIRFLPMPVQLLDPIDHDALRRIVTEIAPVLVVIDTQARVTVGAEENSSRDMGMFVAAADAIREASGACVLVVHHEGRSGEHLRGSTAMEGAATTIMRASKDGPVVCLECKKQKDDEEFPEIAMRLVRLGESAVLSHETVGLSAITTESEHQLITTLRDHFGTEGASTTRLLEASGIAKTSFYRSLKALLTRGVVQDNSPNKRPNYILSSQAQHEEVPLGTN